MAWKTYLLIALIWQPFSREDILAAKPSDAPAKPEEQLVSALHGTGHYTALKTQFSSQKGLFHC